jgi:hypothetical protein
LTCLSGTKASLRLALRSSWHRCCVAALLEVIQTLSRASRSSHFAAHHRKRSRGTTDGGSSMSSSSSIALNKPDILKQILAYAGPGHWLYTIVNSQWVQLCYGVATQQKRAYAADGREYMITCIPQMTLYSSAFASPSRLRLADRQRAIKRSGAAGHRCQYALGRHANKATLCRARSMGLVFDSWTLKKGL